MSDANQYQVVPCACGETLICLCGRCKKCGERRAGLEPAVKALVKAAKRILTMPHYFDQDQEKYEEARMTLCSALAKVEEEGK